MAEGRAGRLFIEGAVIVGSILLAFAIDAAWDYGQERAEEAEVLQALAQEYQVNLTGLELTISTLTEATAWMERFFSMTEEELRALSVGELGEIATNLCPPTSYDPLLGTTETLISSGKLDLLTDRELRAALVNFVNLVGDGVEDIELVRRDAEAVWRREVALGGPWAVSGSEVGVAGRDVEVASFIERPTADALLRARGDAELRGHVERCHINIGYYKLELSRMQEGVALVRARLE